MSSALLLSTMKILSRHKTSSHYSLILVPSSSLPTGYCYGVFDVLHPLLLVSECLSKTMKCSVSCIMTTGPLKGFWRLDCQETWTNKIG